MNTTQKPQERQENDDIGVTALLRQARAARPGIAGLTDEKRRAVLNALADTLIAETESILRGNEKDLAQMEKEDPRYDRLLLTSERIASIAADTRAVAAFTSPLGIVLEDRALNNGLHLKRIAVPLGVVGVIYESRPNVTVDVFALCFKSGNVAVLKGGKEAHNSNTALTAIIRRTLEAQNVHPDAICLLPPDRAATAALLEASGLVDVCIPRGSQALIDHVRKNARIPVIETGAGIVHTYIDAKADAAMARDIVLNAKTRRVSVCNALDTLLAHKDRLGDLPNIVRPLAEKGVEIFADSESHAALRETYPPNLLRHATPEDFGREFLSLKMSVKTVTSMKEALEHIQKHSSGHSEAIVTQDAQAAQDFLDGVDAAAVYVNASTAFTDGGQFGLGAEIGISTQKLHARGPMGLAALTSYKWQIIGDGQVREN